jgi:hypothetical protein
MKPIARAYAAAALLVTAAAPNIDGADPGPNRGSVSGVQSQEPDHSLRGTVRPRIGYAPAVVIIEALVEPADENRFLDFIVDSGEYYRSSTIELTGVRAPRVSVVEFRAVPAGTYDVLISMRGEGGKVRARFHDRLIVK